MFNSIYSDKLSQYYELRCGVLSESAQKHELCYLKRFDNYLNAHIRSTGQITERFINAWVGTLNGKSGSVENEVITIRQFLKYLTLSGEPACIFLCGSTAVPEERKPPVRRKETVKPEQGYRT